MGNHVSVLSTGDGLTGDLPKPGSFLTLNDLGKPILMTRDQEGEFHAFLDVCRHRGTVVEADPRGQKTLSVP